MARARTHGGGRKTQFTKAPEYRVWSVMNDRCRTSVPEKSIYYKSRGISVCDRWQRSFQDFVADMGPRPSMKHSLDRIDNERGYEPGNCRWATAAEQARNRRNNRMVTVGGVTLCMQDTADKFGIKMTTLRSRLNLGWSPETAVSTPVR